MTILHTLQHGMTMTVIINQALVQINNGWAVRFGVKNLRTKDVQVKTIPFASKQKAEMFYNSL